MPLADSLRSAPSADVENQVLVRNQQAFEIEEGTEGNEIHFTSKLVLPEILTGEIDDAELRKSP